MQNAVKASIIGASGYSGIELLKILTRHPHAKIEKIFANTSAGKRLDEFNPWFRNQVNATFETYAPDLVCNSDVVFVALPSGEAMNIVPELLKLGKKVIDLGGDFRLKNIAQYELFYKRKHTSSDLVAQAVYGLPEWNRSSIEKATLVSNPGCYPTSAILPLAPLVKDGLIQSEGITVSSLSGVSGAGRSSSAEMSFVEVNETVKAYKVGVHQHIPEMITTLETLSGKRVALTFVPHLIPITRGIYSSIYTVPVKGVTASDVSESFRKYYSSAPFVRITENVVPEIRNVQYTNYIDIGFTAIPGNNQLVVFSVIDNLVKGAAGQAVQNMNLLFGLNETEGLL